MSQRTTVARALREWRAAGLDCVLATVVASSSSAPRGLGAQLAVSENDTWVGGLSGGCAERVVLHEARQLIAARKQGADDACQSVVVSMTKDELGEAGPVCGATLDVMIEQVSDDLCQHVHDIVEAVAAGAYVRAHREYQAGGSGGERRELVRQACTVTTLGPTEHQQARRDSVVWRSGSEACQLEQELVPPMQLVIGGAGDIAAELLRIAAQLGWQTLLIDPRSAFVEQTLAVAAATTVAVEWPGEALASHAIDHRAACIATAHDDKIDLPFLAASLASPAFYVGSVGSRVVQQQRRDRLEEMVGHSLAQRYRGPVGLDLGGSGAAEIALSIAAEIVSQWNGRSGAPLATTSTAIRAT